MSAPFFMRALAFQPQCALYPPCDRAYKRRYEVEHDDHTHYLPGGLIDASQPGQWCLPMRTAPYLYVFLICKGRL
ncbi:hypothetical protein SAMN04488005_0483 [Yoonia tamlensis]|uniref:Uncharacterized protein n=1 Tax=Yoonia tamlensis TaxID=390270 RepID=A0A1I6FTY1_9RHOB|nr:hypothetical protein SAMN04488005_0483 [Yoonia tamlensis]